MKKLVLTFIVFSALAAPNMVNDEEIIKNLEFAESLDLLQNDEATDFKTWTLEEIMDDSKPDTYEGET